ncbi:MAG: L-serine ammonia-lyase, partial [Lachnospiraceae bacterium]|nr:L-serine ammonia-lyase [Lachnospiraceae bacterium]
MFSLRSLYKIGMGPSSSHTLGPVNAAMLFAARFPEAKHVKVVFYGSLAFPGRG